MVENAYVNEAARGVTASMVSRGEKPSVISAHHEVPVRPSGMRRSLNDAMDLHGGRGICDGPTNYLMAAYQAMPVAITVEGANILTRSLITFAQGALRSHPYLYKEIQACQDADEERGLEAFDKAFCGHVAFSLSSMFGAFFHNITFGLFGHVPEKAYGTAEWYRQLWRASRNFAFVADMTVAVLGGGLKTKQKLTGRLADALSELYLLCCVLKRYEDDGKPANDRHIVALAAQNGLFRFQEALRGTIDNFPVTPVRWLMRVGRVPVRRPLQAGARLARPQGRASWCSPPARCATASRASSSSRNNANDPTGLLEVTMAKVVAAEAAEKKLDRAVRAGQVRRVHGTDWIGDAAKLGVITESEAQLLREVEQLTARVIAVDHFDPAEVKPHYMTAGHNARAMRERRCGRVRREYHDVTWTGCGTGGSRSIRRASPGRCSTARARARTRWAGGRWKSWRRSSSAAEQAARDKAIRGLVFISGKEKGFIVGADVREFDQLPTERADRRQRHAHQRLPRPHRAACRCRSCAASTASASAAASSWRSPATGASPRATTPPGSASPRCGSASSRASTARRARSGRPARSPPCR